MRAENTWRALVEVEVALAVGVWGERAGDSAGNSQDETDEVCRWSELEMMASKENAAALPSRVDPSPLREHFSTCCS